MKLRNTLICTLVLTTLLGGAGVLAADGRDWQLAMLYEPGAAQLKIERRGRVYIYDGLNETDVERALDTQFERLERMMFVRTRVETAAGDYAVEEDGCS